MNNSYNMDSQYICFHSFSVKNKLLNLIKIEIFGIIAGNSFFNKGLLLSGMAEQVENNIKNILIIKHAPKIWLNSESRIRANLAVSPVGFCRGFGKNYDQKLYKMFYDMLYLLNSYCVTTDKKKRVSIQYDIETLYADWYRETSDKTSITENEYNKKILRAKLNMVAAKISNFLSR